jgi:hypothetical protein
MNPTDSKYCYFLTLLFCTVSIVGILRHELWLDEAHHWLLARDSNSITDLYNNTRSEGHPLLWNLLLYGITLCTSNPFGMQLLHVVISTSFVLIFLKKAPFNWIFKTLFIFGYFIIFEYTIISRNYGLGILFLFLACSVFKDRNTKFILLCSYLALASNTHILFSVVAFALFLTLLIEQFQNKQLFKIQTLFGCLIFLLGLVLIGIQIQTTESNWLLDPIQSLSIDERLKPGIVSLFKGLIAIPNYITLHFWNTNFVIDHNRSIAAVLVVMIYLLPIVLFYKNKKTLFFVYIAFIGVQIFFYITQRNAIRFHGINYIIIILALWMEQYYASEHFKLKKIIIRFKLIFLKKPIIYLLLLTHFFSGIYAYSMDYIYPFTSAKQTVDYLKNEGLDSKEIVSVTCDGTIISAYLERKVYFLCSNDYQSFCHWDSDCDQNLNQQKSVAMVLNYMKNHNSCVYVSYYPLSNGMNDSNWRFITDDVKIRFLKKFDLNIVNNSYYYVFEVVKEKRSF